MMCKYDEAFTEKEMLEETGQCADCKLDCKNAGKRLICRDCEYAKYNDHWKRKFCYAPNDCVKNENTCVICGEVIPEGRQVCPNCERKINERGA